MYLIARETTIVVTVELAAGWTLSNHETSEAPHSLTKLPKRDEAEYSL